VSVNWGKYSSPRHTLDLAPDPASYRGVVVMSAGKLRWFTGITVDHAPRNDKNRAHTDVKGINRRNLGGPKKAQEVRLKLLECVDWAIQMDGTELSIKPLGALPRENLLDPTTHAK
jgi:hypothetical protein